MGKVKKNKPGTGQAKPVAASVPAAETTTASASVQPRTNTLTGMPGPAYPVWNTKSVMVLGIPVLILITVFVYAISNRSFIVETERVLLAISSLLFIFFAIGLYSGVRIQRPEKDLGQPGRKRTKKAVECPRCGLINPETAMHCDCGYELKKTTKPVLPASTSLLGKTAKGARSAGSKLAETFEGVDWGNLLEFLFYFSPPDLSHIQLPKLDLGGFSGGGWSGGSGGGGGGGGGGSGGDDVIGCLMSLVLWIVAAIVIAVAVWVLAQVLAIVLPLLAVALYWLFYRALKLVFSKSSECCKQVGPTLKYSLLYTLLYTGWLFVLLEISKRWLG